MLRLQSKTGNKGSSKWYFYSNVVNIYSCSFFVVFLGLDVWQSRRLIPSELAFLLLLRRISEKRTFT